MFATPSQELLLRSALFSGEKAINAWMEWKEQTDLQAEMDMGSFRLLPVVYKNLRLLNVEDAWMGRLKGIYRLTWYKNQALFRVATNVLQGLDQAQIPTLILKGAPLALEYYQDLGVRPMNDFDILVPPAQRDKAIEIILKAGWAPMLSQNNTFTQEIKMVRHAWGFVNPSGQSIDLHWRVFALSSENETDDLAWEKSIPITVNAIQTRTLNPTDMLLHVCVHGGQWDISSSIRWIVDAMFIIRKAQHSIQWEHLVEQAENRRFILPLRLALTYLYDQFQAPIPENTLSQLNHLVVSPIEMKLFKTIASKPTLFGNLPTYWYKYLHQLERRGQEINISSMLNFINYLQQVKGIHSKVELMDWAFRRTLLRLGRFLGGVDQAFP